MEDKLESAYDRIIDAGTANIPDVLLQTIGDNSFSVGDTVFHAQSQHSRTLQYMSARCFLFKLLGGDTRKYEDFAQYASALRHAFDSAETPPLTPQTPSHMNDDDDDDDGGGGGDAASDKDTVPTTFSSEQMIALLSNDVTFWVIELWIRSNFDSALFEIRFDNALYNAQHNSDCTEQVRTALAFFLLNSPLLAHILRTSYVVNNNDVYAHALLDWLVLPLASARVNASDGSDAKNLHVLESWLRAVCRIEKLPHETYLLGQTPVEHNAKLQKNIATVRAHFLKGLRALTDQEMTVHRLWMTPSKPDVNRWPQQAGLDEAQIAWQDALLYASDMHPDVYLPLRIKETLQRQMMAIRYSKKLRIPDRAAKLRELCNTESGINGIIGMSIALLFPPHMAIWASDFATALTQQERWHDIEQGYLDKEKIRRGEITLARFVSVEDMMLRLVTGSSPLWVQLIGITMALLFQFEETPEQLVRLVNSWIPSEQGGGGGSAAASVSSSHIAFEGFVPDPFVVVPVNSKPSARPISVAKTGGKSKVSQQAAQLTALAEDDDEDDACEGTTTTSLSAASAERATRLHDNPHVIPGLVLRSATILNSAAYASINIGSDVVLHLVSVGGIWNAHVLIQHMPLTYYRGEFNVPHTNAHMRVCTVFKQSIKNNKLTALPVPPLLCQGLTLSNKWHYTGSVRQKGEPLRLIDRYTQDASPVLKPCVFGETVRQLAITPPHLNATNAVRVDIEHTSPNVLLDSEQFYNALAHQPSLVHVTDTAESIFPFSVTPRTAITQFGAKHSDSDHREYSLLHALRTIRKHLSDGSELVGEQYLFFVNPCWHIEPLAFDPSTPLEGNDDAQSNFVIYLPPRTTALSASVCILPDGSVRRIKNSNDPRDRLDARLLALYPPFTRGGVASQAEESFTDEKITQEATRANADASAKLASSSAATGTTVVVSRPRQQAQLQQFIHTPDDQAVYAANLVELEKHAHSVQQEPARKFLARAFASRRPTNAKHLVQQHYETSMGHTLGFCFTAKKVADIYKRKENDPATEKPAPAVPVGQADFGQTLLHQYFQLMPCALPNVIAHDCFYVNTDVGASPVLHRFPEHFEVNGDESGSSAGTPTLYLRYVLGHGLIVYVAQILTTEWTWLLFLKRSYADALFAGTVANANGNQVLQRAPADQQPSPTPRVSNATLTTQLLQNMEGAVGIDDLDPSVLASFYTSPSDGGGTTPVATPSVLRPVLTSTLVQSLPPPRTPAAPVEDAEHRENLPHIWKVGIFSVSDYYAYIQARYMYDVSSSVGERFVLLDTAYDTEKLAAYLARVDSTLPPVVREDVKWLLNRIVGNMIIGSLPPWLEYALSKADLPAVKALLASARRENDYNALVGAYTGAESLGPEQRFALLNAAHAFPITAIDPRVHPIGCANLVELIIAQKLRYDAVPAVEVSEQLQGAINVLVRMRLGVSSCRQLEDDAWLLNFSDSGSELVGLNSQINKFALDKSGAFLLAIIDGLIASVAIFKSALENDNTLVFLDRAFGWNFTGKVLAHFFASAKKMLLDTIGTHLAVLRVVKTNVSRLMLNEDLDLMHLYDGINEALPQYATLAKEYTDHLYVAERRLASHSLVAALGDASLLPPTRTMELLQLIECTVLSNRAYADDTLEQEVQQTTGACMSPGAFNVQAHAGAELPNLFRVDLSETPAPFAVGTIDRPSVSYNPIARVTTMQLAALVDQYFSMRTAVMNNHVMRLLTTEEQQQQQLALLPEDFE